MEVIDNNLKEFLNPFFLCHCFYWLRLYLAIEFGRKTLMTYISKLLALLQKIHSSWHYDAINHFGRSFFPIFQKIEETIYNHSQNTLGKTKKSGKFRHDQKTLISVFAHFLSVSAKSFRFF